MYTRFAKWVVVRRGAEGSIYTKGMPRHPNRNELKTVYTTTILKFLQPILEKIKLARLLVTVITGLEWLWILIVMYRTATAAVSL